MTSAHATRKAITEERAAATERIESRAQERQECYEARRGPDTLDMLMTLPYILVPPNELQAMLRGRSRDGCGIKSMLGTGNRQVTAE
jgi:hypothetical protein